MSTVSWKKSFAGVQSIVFENKRTFMKKAVLHTTTLMHCNSRQVSRDLFSTNQENGTERAFVARCY